MHKPWTGKEITRAKRARDVILAHLAAGVPGQYWVAIRLEDGRTDCAAYPTKQAAMQHQHNVNEYAFATIPEDGVIMWAELAAFLRYADSKEAYWRTHEDMHLVLPKFGIKGV